jgi:hypothetical protein
MTSSPKRYVFICGLHRSGTSLLHRILRAHPDISGFTDTNAPEDEGQHVQTVYPAARVYGGPGKFCFAKDAHLDETSPLISAANRERLRLEWERYWDKDKPVRIEKSPPNLIRMRFLQAMFPESTFIIIVRHPLPVSYASQKWSQTGIPELVKHWVAGHHIMQQDLPFIRHSLLLRYEDFVQAPQEHLDKLYQFIGVKSVPCRESVDTHSNQHYFARWETELMKEIELLGNIANGLGYSFTPPYTRSYS